MNSFLVVPSNIPWQELKAEALEELVFWLLDALGAKDLQWRVGATTHHSSDGGRDLEATFHQATPDGEVVAERWWVQCKGRNKAVDRRVAQDGLADAEAVGDVDVLLVVTNSRFTNPTWDWVNQLRKRQRRPAVRLWDRERLERLLIRHPDVVARAAPEALSLQGRLEALTAQFWNQMYFPGPVDLEALWAGRDELTWTERTLVAVTAGELVNGDLGRRPWAAWMECDQLAACLITTLANGLYLAFRCTRFGIDSNKVVRVAAYLSLAGLHRLEASVMKDVLSDPWQFTEGDPLDSNVVTAFQEFLLSPVVAQLQGEVGDICSRDCQRVLTDVGTLAESEAVPSYWDRLIAPSAQHPAPPQDDRHLVIQFWEAPCRIGVVKSENECPLFEDEQPIAERVEQLQRIVSLRVDQRVEGRGP